ncbi:hypothetical protein D3C74_403240 [compost metagenome]
MNKCAQGEIPFGYGVDVQQFADIHSITEDAFGMAEGFHIFVHKQVQLLLDIAYILAEIKLLLQR